MCLYFSTKLISNYHVNYQVNPMAVSRNMFVTGRDIHDWCLFGYLCLWIPGTQMCKIFCSRLEPQEVAKTHKFEGVHMLLRIDLRLGVLRGVVVMFGVTLAGRKQHAAPHGEVQQSGQLSDHHHAHAQVLQPLECSQGRVRAEECRLHKRTT